MPELEPVSVDVEEKSTIVRGALQGTVTPDTWGFAMIKLKKGTRIITFSRGMTREMLLRVVSENGLTLVRPEGVPEEEE